MNADCILWTGALNDQGYGRRGPKLAHRLEWAKVHGPIPPGATIDHLCHDPNLCRLARECPHRRCVNVEHMELVTGSENARRGGRRKAWITACPQGHPYSGENLVIYSGERCCRTCRRTQEAARRATKAADRCRTRGHEREELAGKGRRYCVHCQKAHGVHSSARRMRTGEGRFA